MSFTASVKHPTLSTIVVGICLLMLAGCSSSKAAPAFAQSQLRELKSLVQIYPAPRRGSSEQRADRNTLGVMKLTVGRQFTGEIYGNEKSGTDCSGANEGGADS
jgi:hypothetical protein